MHYFFFGRGDGEKRVQKDYTSKWKIFECLVSLCVSIIYNKKTPKKHNRIVDDNEWNEGYYKALYHIEICKKMYAYEYIIIYFHRIYKYVMK
jgi:hypothetical protein